MPPKTIKTALADMLEDMSQQNFAKFCFQLHDRKEEPRVRRNKVEGKNFLEIADVMVSTFTEAAAVAVAVELLRQIGCNEEAENLVKETSGSSESVFSKQKHFVDENRLELTNRVSNLGPILDELLDKNVIQQESYSEIMALPTSQMKMRKLYCGCLRAGGDCNDIFFEILNKHEPYLINDLKKKK